MSAWIEMIPDEEATGLVKEMYEKVRTPHGTVDNVMRAHSLRPHTMEGHVVLYRSVLHNPANTLPLWFLEVVASYTSIINNCAYSLTHHFMNARRLLNDDARADAIYQALKDATPERAPSPSCSTTAAGSGPAASTGRFRDRRVAQLARQPVQAQRARGCSLKAAQCRPNCSW